MIAFSCLALLLLLPGVWLFARGHSNTQRIGDVRNFNRGVWILSAVLAALCAGYFWLTTGQSEDRAWWPILAALSSAVVAGSTLLLAAAARHFLYAR